MARLIQFFSACLFSHRSSTFCLFQFSPGFLCGLYGFIALFLVQLGHFGVGPALAFHFSLHFGANLRTQGIHVHFFGLYLSHRRLILQQAELFGVPGIFGLQLFDLRFQLGHCRSRQIGFRCNLLLLLPTQLRQQGQLSNARGRVLLYQLRGQFFGNGNVVIRLALLHAHGGQCVGFQRVKAQGLVSTGIPH